MKPLFSFETDYNMNTFISMARALRKIVRKKHSKRSHIFGWGVVVLGAVSVFLWGPKVLTIAAIIVLILALLFEDRLNAWFAMKRMLKGMEKARSDFYEDRYISESIAHLKAPHGGGRRVQGGQGERERQGRKARLFLEGRGRGGTEIRERLLKVPRARAQRNGKKGGGFLTL